MGHPEGRKANGCQGELGGLEDECSGVLHNGRNPWIKLVATGPDSGKLQVGRFYLLRAPSAPFSSHRIASLLVFPFNSLSIQPIPRSASPVRLVSNPIHFYLESKPLGVFKTLLRLPGFFAFTHKLRVVHLI